MKAILTVLTFAISFTLAVPAQAQILQRIKDKAQQSAENRVLDKTERATESALDKTEKAVKKGKGNATEPTVNNTAKEQVAEAAGDTIGRPGSPAGLQAFKNYDFVPGDKLIYFYDLTGEADAEIPARMEIWSGETEVQSYNNEKVLLIPAGGNVSMSPAMKQEAYLPEQFTIEFDILSNGGINTSTDVSTVILYLREKGGGMGDATAPVRILLEGVSGNESGAGYAFEVYKNDDWFGTPRKTFPASAMDEGNNKWRSVAIYINKNIGKLYIDQHRLAVVNQIASGAPAKLEIEIANDENPVMIKNIRIAAGGSDAYKKVMTDGKYIAYGIQFDVNKATLKPQSMGTINEFVKMMKEQPSLNFEIGGHTDSDGTTDRNNVLSRERAEAVKAQMVGMGIDAGRLTTKGYGSSTPVAANDTPENKAKNRRVEFVKSK